MTFCTGRASPRTANESPSAASWARYMSSGWTGSSSWNATWSSAAYVTSSPIPSWPPPRRRMTVVRRVNSGETSTLSQVSRFGILRAGVWYERARTDRHQYPTDPVNNWADQTLPNFPGVALNGFYTSHLIEHLAAPHRLLRWIGERAAAESRIYIEWPNPASVQLPTRDELLEHGIDVVISNFADDLTHRETPEPATVCTWLREAGFMVISGGTIDTGMIGEELFTQATDAGNRTMGYWSITEFSHYLVAVRSSSA